MVLMYIFIGMTIIGAIWIIWECIKYTYNLDDKPKASKPKVTDVPIEADIERLIRQQSIMKYRKAKQYIINILDIAYKDRGNEQTKNCEYISCIFILNVGDYGLTFDEIYAIRDSPFNHGKYEVEYHYEPCFREPFLSVTVYK